MAGTLGGVVFGALGGSPGKHQVQNLLIAAACAIAPIAASAINQLRATKVRRAHLNDQKRAIVAFRSSLNTAHHYLGRLASATSDVTKIQLGGHFIQAVLSAASLLPSAPDTRSLFFRVTDAKMECDGFSAKDARSEASTTIFADDPSDPGGRNMFKMMREGQSLIYPDLTKDAPEGMRPNRSYRTFIAVAVTAGDLRFGALLVDSPEADSFSELDMAIMKTLGNLLGAGLALIPKKA
ncbi:hypothetical protein GCM10027176_36520 [Actinoallomurus bryophytorum]